MQDLGAEVRELHRLVVSQFRNDRRVADQPRVGAHDAGHVGPDIDLAGVEQRAEYRRRQVAAVAPERGLHTVAIARDKAGDDHGAREPLRYAGGQPRPGLVPEHVRAEFRVLDDQHVAGVEPVDRVRQRVGLQQAGQQLGRPQFARPRDQVAHCIGFRRKQRSRVQHVGNVLTAGLEAGLKSLTQLAVAQQFVGKPLMVAAQFSQPRRITVALARQADQVQQPVGHSGDGRNDHRLWRVRALTHDRRHPPEALGIGQAGAAELMDCPHCPVHDRGRLRDASA